MPDFVGVSYQLQNGVPPVIFHLPIEHDGTVLLTAHGDLRALWTHPSDPEGELVQSTVHVWTPEETEWKPCGVHAPFKPLPAHRTLLIKNFETWCTVEFGDVLTQLDRASRVFAEESQAKMIDVCRSSCPARMH